jgi:hypothetical protein
MSDEAEQFTQDAFGETKEFSTRANLARSVYWEDLRRIDQLVKEGKCDVAHMLLTALQMLRDSERDRFAARYSDATVLDEKSKIIASKCPSP